MMRWIYIDVDNYPFECTVCKNTLNSPDYKHGIYYTPVDMTDDQFEKIQALWRCDPFVDFLVCEDCMAGHCGAVTGLTADHWLEEQWAKYINSA
jgi:hypothetical protein